MPRARHRKWRDALDSDARRKKRGAPRQADGDPRPIRATQLFRRGIRREDQRNDNTPKNRDSGLRRRRRFRRVIRFKRRRRWWLRREIGRFRRSVIGWLRRVTWFEWWLRRRFRRVIGRIRRL